MMFMGFNDACDNHVAVKQSQSHFLMPHAAAHIIEFSVDLSLGNLCSPLPLHQQTMFLDQATGWDGHGCWLVCTQSLLNDLHCRHSGTFRKLCCPRTSKH